MAALCGEKAGGEERLSADVGVLQESVGTGACGRSSTRFSMMNPETINDRAENENGNESKRIRRDQ